MLKDISTIIVNFLKFINALRIPALNWGYLGKISTNCTIDDLVKINAPANLDNVAIGYGTYLAGNSWISYTEIGKFCSIGPNVFCGWGIHPSNGLSTAPYFYSTLKQNGQTLSLNDKIQERKSIKIGHDVLIGANVTILDGVTIGNGAIVGACSLINKDVPPYSIVGGTPARIIRYRFDDAKIEKLLSIAWWNWNVDRLFEVEKYFFDVDNFINDFYKP